MKKFLLSSAAVLFALGLSACGSEDTSAPKEKEANQSSETTAKQVTDEKKAPTTTFQNGTLETEKFSLTISKTEIIQSPMEDKPGLFVTFTLTNKTKDEDVVPNDTLVNLLAQQENGTSRVDLSENYYFLDAFGGEDDVDTYNKMVDLDNASADTLLPGKTVEFVAAYTLDNNTHDVTFTGMDQNTFEEVGKYTVNLK